MALNEILEVLAANPQLLAAVLAIIYNIAGYIMSMLKIQAFEKWQWQKALETLVLFEALFTILQTLAGVPASWVAIITIVIAVVRSLQAKISEYIKLLSSS